MANKTWLLIVLVFLLFWSCTQDFNPLLPAGSSESYPPLEGEVSLVYRFHDLNFEIVSYDTLVLKEFQNAIYIDNAVTVDFPAFENLTISFFGDFEETDDRVVICYQKPYQDTEALGRTHILKAMNLFNRWFGSFLPLIGHAEEVQEMKFFIFVIDLDNNNSGKGKVTFTNKTLTKTVWIDAAQNTVDIHERSVSKYLKFPLPISQYQRDNDIMIPLTQNKDILYLFPFSDKQLGPIQLVMSAYGSGVVGGSSALNGMVYAFFPVFKTE